jgi:hypothetical protein
MLHGKKVRPITIIIVLLIVGSYLLNHFVFKVGDPISSLDDELRKTSVDMNKMCPVKVDDETRLDKTEAPGNKTLIYFLTIVNYSKENFDTLKFRETRFPEIIAEFTTSEKMKLFRDNNVTVIYKYFDNKGVFLQQLTITPEIYKRSDESLALAGSL